MFESPCSGLDGYGSDEAVSAGMYGNDLSHGPMVGKSLLLEYKNNVTHLNVG